VAHDTSASAQAIDDSGRASTSERLRAALRPSTESTFYERWGVAIFLAVVWALAAALVPEFRSWVTTASILRESAFIGAATVGMTLAILSGVFDLSVGGNVALASVLSLMALGPLGVVGALVVAIASATALGLVNGIVVAKLQVPAFVATLGTLFAFRGIAFLVTDGAPVRVPNDMFESQFTAIGAGSIARIPTPFVIMLGTFGIGYIILRQTVFGRYLLAVGSNEEAARFAGVDVPRVRLRTFALIGFFAGFASILLTTRIWTADGGTQQGFELTVIAATVLGGTSLSGGRGTLVGTGSAVVLMVTLQRVMLLASVPSFYQRIVTGLVLLAALGVDGVRSRKRR
jgi:ribose transport system permease protein